jgi:hypothetical protein
VLKIGLPATCAIFKFSPQILCDRLAKYGHFWLASFITRKHQYGAALVIGGNIWPLSIRSAMAGTGAELLTFCRWVMDVPQYYRRYSIHDLIGKTGDLDLCNEYVVHIHKNNDLKRAQNMILPTLIANKDRAGLKELKLEDVHMRGVVDTGDLDFIKWATNEYIRKQPSENVALQKWRHVAHRIKNAEVADWLCQTLSIPQHSLAQTVSTSRHGLIDTYNSTMNSEGFGRPKFIIPNDPKLMRRYIANINSYYFMGIYNHPCTPDQIYTWNNIMCLQDNYSIEDISFILDSYQREDNTIAKDNIAIYCKCLLVTRGNSVDYAPFGMINGVDEAPQFNASRTQSSIVDIVKRYIDIFPNYVHQLFIMAKKARNAPLASWLNKYYGCESNQSYGERLLELISGPYEDLKTAIDLNVHKSIIGESRYLFVAKILSKISKLSIEMKKKATLLCEVGLLTLKDMILYANNIVLHWYLGEYFLVNNTLCHSRGHSVFLQLLNNEDNWQLLYSREETRYICALISVKFCDFIVNKRGEKLFVRLRCLHDTSINLLGANLLLCSILCDKMPNCKLNIELDYDCEYCYYKNEASYLWDLFNDFANSSNQCYFSDAVWHNQSCQHCCLWQPEVTIEAMD